MTDEPMYEWTIMVRRWNTYGDKIEGQVPMTILAANKSEITAKVRQAFEAQYDDFRKHWSHDWVLESAREVP